MFHKEKYLSLENVTLMEKFANHYKMVFLKKQPTRVVISLVSLTRLRKPCQQKNAILLNGITIHYRNMLQKKRARKFGCFTGFCHHRLTTMSAHTHAYRYPLVESGRKTGLRAIALCRKDRVLLSKHK